MKMFTLNFVSEKSPRFHKDSCGQPSLPSISLVISHQSAGETGKYQALNICGRSIFLGQLSFTLMQFPTNCKC